MTDPRAPFVRPPLTFSGGRVVTTDLEGSIRQHIRLLIDNYVQGVVKAPGVAADPEFGTELPHHDFRHGRRDEVIRVIRLAIQRNERRLNKDVHVEYGDRSPGRYLPQNTVRVRGTIAATGEAIDMEFEIER